MSQAGNPRVTRRRALGWLGGVGLALVVPGCADDDSPESAGGTTTTTEATTTAATTSPDCVLTPELTEGPYYLDLDLMRRDITEGRPGLAYDLAVKVVDAESCEAIEDAIVDVWHCDAEGAYSGVDGDGGHVPARRPGGRRHRYRHLPHDLSRLVPGPGRPHPPEGDPGRADVDGQLFFDDATLDRVYGMEPYSARGSADVSNSSDGIFGQSGGSTVVSTDVGSDLATGQVTLGIERVYAN